VRLLCMKQDSGTGCKMIESNQIRICDVCRLLDFSCEKKVCSYCSLCDAWICPEDQSKWGRRLLAAAKRKMEPGFKGIHNYEELVQGGHNDAPTDFGTNAKF
jgi:hypothetical protein